jgi:DNA mismatch repair protein MutS2
MDQHTFETLELSALLDLLARHVQTPIGRRRVLYLRPTANRATIDGSLNLTTECVQFLDSGRQFGLSGMDDPEPGLARLQVEGTTLEARQVLELEHLVAVAMNLRDLFRGAEEREHFPSLAAIMNQIPDLRRLLAEIRGKVLPDGQIDDNASPELRRIRHELQVSRTRIHRALESILRQQARAVQEEIITFRNGRFVIPVRTDSRVQVPGVVHGLSSSGQTTFIEPLSVIDQNNDLVRLHEQEEIEIARILLAITEAFRANRQAIRSIAETIADIDLGQAKARLSLEFACVRPRISDGREILLRDARHLLLEHALRQSGNCAVPISLALDDAHQVLVISGPNAGGKTVVLKTMGLIALMAQMGLHVPANEAVLPVFGQVLADIGDQQSIAANLSTFTAHMRNIATMAGKVVSPTLLLIDEVGTGTDPEEGAALAVAVVDYFRRAGATTLATTHYNPLKMWASQTEGVLNASVEFDERTLRPTYRLIMGVAGASSGLEIAHRMDVPDSILEQARSLANPDHTLASEYLKRLKTLVDEQAALRAALEAERAATARKLARLDEEFSQREAARRAEFESALERATREFNLQSEQLIRSLKDRITSEKLKKVAQNRAAQLRHSGREATQRIEAEIGLDVSGPAGKEARAGSLEERRGVEPAEGDRVWVRPLSQAGIVESIHEETYTVSVGSLKFRARRGDLQFLETASSPAQGRPQVKPAPELSLDQQFTPEINVIGLTADEAVQRVDKFLDDAFLAGAESVRIIHGHGKGILRRAIAELLTGHPQVHKFQLAPPDQGGGGATIVDLQK